MTHEMQQLVLAISFRSSQSVLGSDVEVPLSDLARSVVNSVSATFWWDSSDCVLVGWAVVIHWEQIPGIVGQLGAVVLVVLPS